MDSVINTTELSTASRVRRIVAGGFLIGITMTVTGPLGYLALLPLLAIYPILTGLFGEDPLDGLLANWQGGFEGRCFRPSTRVALLVAGGAAMGVMMFSPEHVGVRALLAFAALYPIMAGLFGEDLVSMALGFGQEKQAAPRVETASASRRIRKTAVVGQRSAPARHHWFGHGAGPKAA